MADPTFPLIPLLAFVSLLMTLVPFGYISFQEHTGIVMFMFWQSVNCVQTFINRILWHGTTEDLAPVWCDIITKIELAKAIGLPASVLCMIRGICRVFQMENHFDSVAKKRRMIWESLAIALAFPLIAVCIYPFIAASRYLIVEDIGCTNQIRINWISFAGILIWPFIISVVTVVYCALTLLKCLKMPRKVLTGQSELNRFVFSRTLVCAGVTSLTLFPICAYNLVYNLKYGIAPHPGLAEIAKYRKVVSVIKPSHMSSAWDSAQFAYLSAVEHTLPSFCFFLIFGTGDVAVRYYSCMLSRITTKLGLRRSTEVTGTAGNGIVFAAWPGATVDSKASISIDVLKSERMGRVGTCAEPSRSRASG